MGHVSDSMVPSTLTIPLSLKNMIMVLALSFVWVGSIEAQVPGHGLMNTLHDNCILRWIPHCSVLAATLQILVALGELFPYQLHFLQHAWRVPRSIGIQTINRALVCVLFTAGIQEFLLLV